MGHPTLLFTLALACGGAASAASFQGVVVDRSCAVDMVKNGRANTLKAKPECSMNGGKYVRSSYALITEEKKLYYLDDKGNKQAVTLLKNTPDPDQLKILVTGDLNGQTIKVQDMSML
jgi:hypothetical protein